MKNLDKEKGIRYNENASILLIYEKEGDGILMKKRMIVMVLCLGVGVLAAIEGCSGKEEQEIISFEDAGDVTKQPEVKKTVEVKKEFEEEGIIFKGVDEEVYTTTKLNVRESCSTDSKVIKMLPEKMKIRRIGVSDIWSKISIEEGEYYVATEYLTKDKPKMKGHIVAINAGHQEKDNTEKEAIGPGATETKEKVTSGTKGVVTGLHEYELTLQVGKMVEEQLKEDGYEVFMIRESNDLNMGNKERAQMAAEAGAEILVHLHANGSKVSSTNGAMAVCVTKASPYVPTLYQESRKLADAVISQYVNCTGAKNKGVWETDLMIGLNWSSIPAINLEMGFMSNPQEDKKMADSEYQQKMAQGIVAGIESYFEND